MIRILLVDDVRSIHLYIKEILSKTKELEFTSVYNGLEAIKILEQDSNFNLILLDWEMPILDGPSTFEVILRKNFKIPTLMMTTKNDPKDILKMLEMGVSEYIFKPFTADIICEKIETALGKNIFNAA